MIILSQQPVVTRSGSSASSEFKAKVTFLSPRATLTPLVFQPSRMFFLSHHQVFIWTEFLWTVDVIFKRKKKTHSNPWYFEFSSGPCLNFFHQPGSWIHCKLPHKKNSILVFLKMTYVNLLKNLFKNILLLCIKRSSNDSLMEEGWGACNHNSFRTNKPVWTFTLPVNFTPQSLESFLKVYYLHKRCLITTVEAFPDFPTLPSSFYLAILPRELKHRAV